MIVGVAGKYCSGKSTVTRYLTERGFLEINLDRLGHAALGALKTQVVERFGGGILDEAGEIDRKKLGSIVFRDESRRLLLEELLHPRMVEMAGKSIVEHIGKNIVIDGALLFYMGVDKLCEIAVWVRAPFHIRFFRAVRRDRLPLSSLLQRFRAQRDLSPQPSSNGVDIYYIRNTGSPAALREKLDRILLQERM